MDDGSTGDSSDDRPTGGHTAWEDVVARRPSAFRDDLASGLADPGFREQYERVWAEAAARAGDDGIDADQLVEDLAVARTVAERVDADTGHRTTLKDAIELFGFDPDELDAEVDRELESDDPERHS